MFQAHHTGRKPQAAVAGLLLEPHHHRSNTEIWDSGDKIKPLPGNPLRVPHRKALPFRVWAAMA